MHFLKNNRFLIFLILLITLFLIVSFIESPFYSGLVETINYTLLLLIGLYAFSDVKNFFRITVVFFIVAIVIDWMQFFDPDGEFFAALGSPGGAQIIGYTLQGIVSLIDAEMSMQEAAAAPRITNENGPTVIEQGTLLEDFITALTSMGHEVRPRAFESGLNGIRRVADGYEGGADPRRSGVALGD